jgi:hypothetical protein
MRLTLESLLKIFVLSTAIALLIQWMGTWSGAWTINLQPNGIVWSIVLLPSVLMAGWMWVRSRSYSR